MGNLRGKKRVEIVVMELFDWSYTTKKMQPTNFEVNHFEPYPGDEKKGGTSRSPKVWNLTATKFALFSSVCVWAIALRLLVATKKQQFRCGPQLLEMYCQNWEFS